jgi:hypothetical protein
MNTLDQEVKLSFYFRTTANLIIIEPLYLSVFPHKSAAEHSDHERSIAIWGWRVGNKYRKRGRNILVIERGYLGNRFKWTSLGWNGLNGYANFFNENVADDRWMKYWKNDMKPWRGDQGDYVLVCGQVPRDAALSDCNDYPKFLTNRILELQKKFGKVAFRPHPLASKTPMMNPAYKPITEIPGVMIMDHTKTSLTDDMQNARLVVAWNSNSLVEAMYMGVPFESHSAGSMVHKYQTGFEEPDRDDWGRKIAYCQWNLEELKDGTAWRHIKQGLI